MSVSTPNATMLHICLGKYTPNQEKSKQVRKDFFEVVTTGKEGYNG